jgi:nitrogen PTS system EIIA component
VPEHATEQHLNVLSELAQLFSDADLRDRLLAENDIGQVHRLLQEWTPYATYAPTKSTAAL